MFRKLAFDKDSVIYVINPRKAFHSEMHLKTKRPNTTTPKIQMAKLQNNRKKIHKTKTTQSYTWNRLRTHTEKQTDK